VARRRGPEPHPGASGGAGPALVARIWGLARLWVARAGVWLLRPALELMIDRMRLWDHLVVGPRDRIHIDPSATISNAILNSSSGSITIGPNAFFGQHVQILAGTHDATLRGSERFDALPAGGHDVVIEEGAWIASGAIVIGPCVIGRDAVVAAGAVVTADVPAGTMVAGVPARVVRPV
jgi:acetyltransferase-like isoleucine patch superfamily enzyme